MQRLLHPHTLGFESLSYSFFFLYPRLYFASPCNPNMGLSKPPLEPCSKTRNCRPAAAIPTIDLSLRDSRDLLVRACEELGFFKVVNHGVPAELISRLESQARRFFALPLPDKHKAAAPHPYGYGNRAIGSNGDTGWVEYLLMNPSSRHGAPPEENFRRCVEEYAAAVRGVACRVAELMAEGLGVEDRKAFSRLLMDEGSDSWVRVNHYPPFPGKVEERDRVVGFGEHTDPQILSVLRSNNVPGLEIRLRDGRWAAVPHDEGAFFINVGDSLQVLTNGRFRSVRHRVWANGVEPRVSMIYFGGPPLSEKIAPLPCLIQGEEESLYREFTWFEYKRLVFSLHLADNRLLSFQKIAAGS